MNCLLAGNIRPSLDAGLHKWCYYTKILSKTFFSCRLALLFDLVLMLVRV